MAITRGFGKTFYIERGAYRHWTMGGDGVRRWVDDGSEVGSPEALRQAGKVEQERRGASNLPVVASVVAPEEKAVAFGASLSGSRR